MPIVESVLLSSSLQADGSRNVTERHIDQNGVTYDLTYLCPVGVSPEDVLLSRVPVLEAGLIALEPVVAEKVNFVVSQFWIDALEQASVEECAEIRAAVDYKLSGGKLSSLVVSEVLLP